MEIFYTSTFEELFEKLPRHIKKKAERKIYLFKQNSFLPILKTEKLNIPFGEFWSFRIDRVYRIIFAFEGSNKVIFHAVGHHSWIYRFILGK